jgi:energy-coupling factor transport system permease protein
MTDALDRSLGLAAAMDARGFGRTRRVASRGQQALSGALVLIGLCGVCVGLYSLLDGTAPALLGAPLLVAGFAFAAAGMVAGGRRVHTSRYRPDPWAGPEWLVAATGAAVAIGMFVVGHVDPANLDPSLQPLQWPTLPWAAVVVILVGALPAWFTPPPPLTSVVPSPPRPAREPNVVAATA